MAIRDLAGRAAAAGLLGFACTSCTVANLSYGEIERDLDAIVRVEGQGAEERLKYESDVPLATWYARSSLLLPIRPILMWILPATDRYQLENPSERVRELLVELAPKAGGDLQRNVATVRRLVRILQLDPSALNRLTALDGIGLIADRFEIDLVAGLERGSLRLQVPDEAPQWLRELGALVPQQRGDGGRLSAEQANRYRSVLAALTAQPWPTWQQRLALVGDLGRALADERDDELVPVVRTALQNALRHAVQWAVVEAVQGQSPLWVDVRLRALDLLHRAGGPDSVPLLLALMMNSAENKAAGMPDFDPDVMMQRRLIHLCGQLDRVRAEQSVLLPGREKWQAVAPAEFLAIRALQDGFLDPTALPAREALAHCIGRPRLGLGEDQAEGEDWVLTWREDFQRRQAAR